MEHTKGDWEIQGGTNAKGDLFIWPAGFYYGGHAIATIHGDIQEGAEGNAHLIAAAPDLLAACKFLMADMSTLIQLVQNGHSLDSFNNDSFTKATAAIAGAKGK